MAEEARPAMRQARDLRWRWLFALWLVVALWPPLGAPLDGSFDSSWRWGAAVVAARALPAGLLPIGPLGGWLEPRAIASGGLGSAALLAVATRLLWVVALAGLLGGRPAWRRWAGLAALWLGGTWVAGRAPDEELVLLVLVLMIPWWEAGDEARAASLRRLAAGLLAGFACFLKPSAGLEAGAVLAGVAAVRALCRRRLEPRPLAGLGAAVAAGLAGGAWRAFDSWPELARWATAVPEVLRGYGATMALEASAAARLASAGSLLGVAAAAGYSFARRSRAAWFWLATSLVFLPVLEHALVRPDVHLLGLVAWSAGVLGVAVVLAEGRREAALALAAGGLALGLAWPQARALGPPRSAAGLVRRLVGLEGAANALAHLRPGAREEELERVGSRRLAALRRSELAAPELARGGIDAVPWRLGLLAANGLERAWVPSPSLQFFQASTPELERRQAAHFAGAAAPRWLVVHFDPLDARNPLWEAPRTWREIAARYRIAGRPTGLLLLERRAVPARWREREVGRSALRWGAWTVLPEVLAGECLVARVELEPTVAGGLRQALFRAEPVELDLRGAGRRATRRLVPKLADQGLVLDAAPVDLAGLAAWLEGGGEGPWRRVRWRSRDAGRYAPATVRWLALRLEEPAG